MSLRYLGLLRRRCSQRGSWCPSIFASRSRGGRFSCSRLKRWEEKRVRLWSYPLLQMPLLCCLVAPGCACVFGAPERSGLCFFSRHLVPSDGYLSASHEKQY